MNLKAINASTYDDSMPAGTIVMWGGSNIANLPSGWLLCDGKVYDGVKQYPDLSVAIGSNFGFPPPGSPAGSFRVPDLRGFFIRGCDDGTNDPDYGSRTEMGNSSQKYSGVGSVQDDEFEKHHHGYSELNSQQGDGIAGGSHWHNTSENTDDTGGTETRPKNVYLYFIIKVTAAS